MIEKRNFQRVRLTANIILHHNGLEYKGKVENISISGALVRLERTVIVSLGGEYILTINVEGEDIPLQIFVEVACASISLAGIKFVSCAAETSARLLQLLQNLTTKPDTPETDREKIRLHLNNYLR
jgi:PilZ domain